MTVVIERATLDDLPWIMNMHHHYLQCGHDEEYFERHLDLVKPWVWTAREQDTPLGYIMARNENGWVHVVSMAVERPRRRKGVATDLMNLLMEEARAEEESLFGVWGHVRESNLSAQDFYERTGFLLSFDGYYEDDDGKILFLQSFS